MSAAGFAGQAVAAQDADERYGLAQAAPPLWPGAGRQVGQFQPQQVERIELASLEILERTGTHVLSPEAMDLLEQFVDKHGGSERAAEALILLANEYFRKNELDRAEKYYRRYIDKFSHDPVFTFNAYNGLGGVYEEKGDYKKAGEIYERYLKKYKDSTFTPMMLLNAGKAYYLAGDKDAARRNFEAITENFQDSREKQEAAFFLEMLN